jgi:hypothetical protein
MRRVALTGAAVALVLSLAGVVAISAASQAAEPGTRKAKTLTFDVVFSPFSPIAANNVRDPTRTLPSGTSLSFTTSSWPRASRSVTIWAHV